MTSKSAHVDVSAAAALRSRSILIRIAIMAAVAEMLWTFSDWDLAFAWWSTYAAIQIGMLAVGAADTARRRRVLYGLSFLTYAVAGFPTWHLWTKAGDLGIAAATMLLCGLLLQLVVSSLGAKRLFLASAAPLVGYLVFVPPFVLGTARLPEGLAASACAVLLVAYLLVLWMGQQRALQAIDAERNRAEAASQAKTDFLAAMSHELRTPMNAVLGSANLLSRTGLSAEQTSLVTMLTDGGAVLMHVLNDVLDLAKIEAGKLDIDPANVDLHDFVRRCSALWRPRAEDKGLDLRLEISPGTPQYLVLDASRCGQIIFNLISNALKFTESGAVALQVGASPVDGDSVDLTISVVDTGMGMTRETQAELFGAFRQADSSITRRFGGTGLGLSISQKLANMMGGDISVQSELGAGSRFTLKIKCGLGHAIVPALASAADPNDDLLPSARILVAEDNLSNQRIIEMFLQPIGADVTIVDDGQQALDALAVAPFDLVLMDMQMPVMDGLEATRRLRAGGGVNARIPVLALTANVMDAHREACRDAGMTGHIAKPIDARVLLAAVIQAIDPTFDSLDDEGHVAAA